ncbi:hypothetical protein BDP67DRAFT_521101 [Colletotrichum lupini]|nr:hypothetical protein BDP67DRAFT_521101 [Colletotrichum lupini]
MSGVTEPRSHPSTYPLLFSSSFSRSHVLCPEARALIGVSSLASACFGYSTHKTGHLGRRRHDVKILR